MLIKMDKFKWMTEHVSLSLSLHSSLPAEIYKQEYMHILYSYIRHWEDPLSLVFRYWWQYLCVSSTKTWAKFQGGRALNLKWNCIFGKWGALSCFNPLAVLQTYGLQVLKFDSMYCQSTVCCLWKYCHLCHREKCLFFKWMCIRVEL